MKKLKSLWSGVLWCGVVALRVALLVVLTLFEGARRFIAFEELRLVLSLLKAASDERVTVEASDVVVSGIVSANDIIGTFGAVDEVYVVVFTPPDVTICDDILLEVPRAALCFAGAP